MSIQFKVAIGDHSIRRYKLPANITLEDFQQRVKQDMPDHFNDIIWQYIDEEHDYVVFSSQQEWENALQNHQQFGAHLFKVIIKKQQERLDHPYLLRPNYRRYPEPFAHRRYEGPLGREMEALYK
jgi:hypothetical protein